MSPPDNVLPPDWGGLLGTGQGAVVRAVAFPGIGSGPPLVTQPSRLASAQPGVPGQPLSRSEYSFESVGSASTELRA